MNAELIEALRYCAEHEGCDYYIAKDCPRESTWMCGVDCNQILMLDAAAALKAADKRIAELNTKCADLQSQINSMENEIEELMPKEGEWIDLFGHDYKCSVCGEWYRMDGTPEQEDMNYCPNCGARMRKGERYDHQRM